MRGETYSFACPRLYGYIALSGLVDSTSFWGGKCVRDAGRSFSGRITNKKKNKKGEKKDEGREKNIRIIARNGVECLESSHRKLISFRGLAPGPSTQDRGSGIFLSAVVKQNLSMIGLLFAHIYLNADFIYTIGEYGEL